MSESDKPGPRSRGKKVIGGSKGNKPNDEAVAGPAETLPDSVEVGSRGQVTERRANIKLQLGFFSAVVAGTAAAMAGYAPGLSWLGFAGPLLAIAAFYVFGLSQGFVARTDTRQQFADGCYFLGFLLTMVAMLVGFLPAGLLGQEITSQGILRHFSMALGATALGLVCRILVLQGGRSIGQIAAEVETELTTYARKVSAEARAIGEELENVRVGLELQRAQVASLITTDMKNAVQAAFDPITRAAGEISSSLETQARSITSSASSLQQALSQSVERLAEAAEVRDDANDAASAAMTSVASALGEFESQIAALRKELSEAVAGSAGEIKKMTSALEKGTALAPALAPAIAGLQENVVQASDSIASLRSQSDQLTSEMSDRIKHSQRALEDLESSEKRIADAIEYAGRDAGKSISQEGELTRQELERVRSEFSSILKSEHERAAEQMKRDAAQFSSDLTSVTDQLAEILRSFATRIEEARFGASR